MEYESATIVTDSMSTLAKIRNSMLHAEWKESIRSSNLARGKPLLGMSSQVEHKADLRKKGLKRPPLHIHNCEKLSHLPTPGFRMRMTEVFGGDATKRQVRERGVLIQKTGSGKADELSGRVVTCGELSRIRMDLT